MMQSGRFCRGLFLVTFLDKQKSDIQKIIPMRIIVNISRIIVGLLFIFSGLIKANDPLGLTYKMQEFFEIWGNSYPSLQSLMMWLNDYALAFSVITITLEVVVGVALLLGWGVRFFSWLLLLLIIFFTFLTGYAVLSGK